MKGNLVMLGLAVFAFAVVYVVTKFWHVPSAGNVWQWCNDWHLPNAYDRVADLSHVGFRCVKSKER